MNKSLYQHPFFKFLLLVIVAVSLTSIPVNAQQANSNSTRFTKSEPAGLRVILNRKIKQSARETIEIPINLTENAEVAITFFASPKITVSLIDSAGKTQQSVKAGSPQSLEMIKTFHLTGEIAGAWKLRFENESDESHTSAVSVSASKNPPALIALAPITQ